MVQIVAVNGLGYTIPLNFDVIGSGDLLNGKSILPHRGLYEFFGGDVTLLSSMDERETTYQLPMPEFGV